MNCTRYKYTFPPPTRLDPPVTGKRKIPDFHPRDPRALGWPEGLQRDLALEGRPRLLALTERAVVRFWQDGTPLFMAVHDALTELDTAGIQAAAAELVGLGEFALSHHRKPVTLAHPSPDEALLLLIAGVAAAWARLDSSVEHVDRGRLKLRARQGEPTAPLPRKLAKVAEQAAHD